MLRVSMLVGFFAWLAAPAWGVPDNPVHPAAGFCSQHNAAVVELDSGDSIQSAINHAGDGLTCVLLNVGTYSGSVSIGRSDLLLLGPRFNVPAPGRSEAEGEAVVEGTITVSASNAVDRVRIDGLSIHSGSDSGILNARLGTGEGSDALSGVFNNIIRGSWVSGSTPNNRGVSTASSSPVVPQAHRLIGNDISGYRFGLSLDGNSQLESMVVRANRLTGNERGIQSQAALHTAGGGDSAFVLIIDENLISDNQQGIRLAGGHATIRDNQITGNEVFGIRPGVANAPLDGLTITVNSISGSGVGLLFDSVPSSSAALAIQCNTIANNTMGALADFPIDARLNDWLGVGEFGPELAGPGGSNHGPLDESALPSVPNYSNPDGQGNSVSAQVRYWPWLVSTLLLEPPPVNGGDFGPLSIGDEPGTCLLPPTSLVPVTPVPGAGLSIVPRATVYVLPEDVTAFEFELLPGGVLNEVFQREFEGDGVTFSQTSLATSLLVNDADASAGLKTEVHAVGELQASIAAIIKTGSFTSFVQITPSSPPVIAFGDAVPFALNVNHRRYRSLLRVVEVKIDGVSQSIPGCIGERIIDIGTCDVGPIEALDVIIEFVIGT